VRVAAWWDWKFLNGHFLMLDFLAISIKLVLLLASTLHGTTGLDSFFAIDRIIQS
jgi:hypothetical protein